MNKRLQKSFEGTSTENILKAHLEDEKSQDIERATIAKQHGLHPDASLQEIHNTMRIQIVIMMHEVDQMLTTEFTAYIRAMYSAIETMNQYICSKPENFQAIGAAQSFLIALRKLNAETKKNPPEFSPQILPLFKTMYEGIFEMAKIYFSFHNRINQCDYPLTLEEALLPS